MLDQTHRPAGRARRRVAAKRETVQRNRTLGGAASCFHDVRDGERAATPAACGARNTTGDHEGSSDLSHSFAFISYFTHLPTRTLGSYKRNVLSAGAQFPVRRGLCHL